jgi:glucokinase
MDRDAAEISQMATQGEPYCREALALFFSIYGSESGNLALATLPFGGIYLAGGIAAKNIDALTQSEFVSAFCNKSKMHSLLQQMPVHVIKNQAVGLLGARWHASHSP